MAHDLGAAAGMVVIGAVVDRCRLLGGEQSSATLEWHRRPSALAAHPGAPARW